MCHILRCNFLFIQHLCWYNVLHKSYALQKGVLFMKKEVIHTIKCIGDASRTGFLLKYLLVEEDTSFENSVGLCTYGIEIVKTQEDTSESQQALSISCDKQKVLSFIWRLAYGAVTPITLCDVVCELVCEKKNTFEKSDFAYSAPLHIVL